MLIHVRFEGRSFDLSAAHLRLNGRVDDATIKAGLARHLDVARERLDGYVVDRMPSGDLIVRPEAVYG